MHTNSLQLVPSWEANNPLPSQDIPRILWNLKIHYCASSIPPAVLSSARSVPSTSYDCISLSCRLDDPGFKSRQEQSFVSSPKRPDRPASSGAYCALYSGRQVYHSNPSSAKAKNELSYVSTTLICIHNVGTDNSNFYPYLAPTPLTLKVCFLQVSLSKPCKHLSSSASFTCTAHITSHEAPRQ
jgi:hypothetical protein